MRPTAAALTISSALAIGAFTPLNPISSAGVLRLAHDVGLGHDAAPFHLTAEVSALAPAHPIIRSVVPPGLLSPKARHLPAASPGPACDDGQARGRHARYQGRSVSNLYDQVFQPTAAMPYLQHYVPQALTTWTDWDGAGHTIVLLGMYREGHPSYLIGLQPETNSWLGTVEVAASHLGGMAFLAPYLFTGDNPWPKPGASTVTRYDVTALRAAMQEAINKHDKPFLKQDGSRQAIDATDFMAVSGDSMYTGNHGNPIPGVMNEYKLTPDGWLQKVAGPWQVPARAQGLVITPDDFLFSTDNDKARGALIVVRRADVNNVAPKPVGCVWMPSMPEDITVYNGNLTAVFESGVRWHTPPQNRITHVHSGALDSLLSVADPIALGAEQLLGIAPALPGLPGPTKPAAPAAPSAPGIPIVPGLGGGLPLLGGLTKPAPNGLNSSTPSGATPTIPLPGLPGQSLPIPGAPAPSAPLLPGVGPALPAPLSLLSPAVSPAPLDAPSGVANGLGSSRGTAAVPSGPTANTAPRAANPPATAAQSSNITGSNSATSNTAGTPPKGSTVGLPTAGAPQIGAPQIGAAQIGAARIGSTATSAGTTSRQALGPASKTFPGAVVAAPGPLTHPNGAPLTAPPANTVLGALPSSNWWPSQHVSDAFQSYLAAQHHVANLLAAIPATGASLTASQPGAGPSQVNSAPAAANGGTSALSALAQSVPAAVSRVPQVSEGAAGPDRFSDAANLYGFRPGAATRAN